jgi:hypothetical protein
MEKKTRNLNLNAETLYNDLINLTSLLLAVGDALENKDNLYAEAIVVARHELEAACVVLQRAL